MNENILILNKLYFRIGEFMIKIKEVMNPDVKTQITLEIMNALPLWFSPPEDIEKKSVINREYPFIAVYDEEKVIGFVALKIHNKYTVEVYILGVLEQYHRHGIGHLLIGSCVDYCQRYNYTYLSVKTLDGSAKYEPYDKTRAFYFKEGFIPLEVFTTYWNEDNPCLFLVKSIPL